MTRCTRALQLPRTSTTRSAARAFLSSPSRTQSRRPRRLTSATRSTRPTSTRPRSPGRMACLWVSVLVGGAVGSRRARARRHKHAPLSPGYPWPTYTTKCVERGASCNAAAVGTPNDYQVASRNGTAKAGTTSVPGCRYVDCFVLVQNSLGSACSLVAPNVLTINTQNFDTFALGSIKGQQGWNPAMTNAFDQDITLVRAEGGGLRDPKQRFGEEGAAAGGEGLRRARRRRRRARPGRAPRPASAHARPPHRPHACGATSALCRDVARAHQPFFPFLRSAPTACGAFPTP